MTMKLMSVGVLWLLLGSLRGPGGVAAPPTDQCPDVDGAVETPDVAPVPLMTNPVPAYPPLLLDAGIGDTAVVRFVVGRDGSIDPSSYCMERAPVYSWSIPDEVRQWRFAPARHGGSIVAAKYRLTVVYAPRDTVRGPIRGARVLGEMHQPLLQGNEPRLSIGPMRLTFGVPRTGAVGDLGRSIQDTLLHRVLELADLQDIPLVCLRVADRSFLEWDGAARTTKGEVRARCAANPRALHAEIWLTRDNPPAGRHEGGLMRIPVTLRVNDFSHCPARAFLCGGGLRLGIDCEVLIRNEEETVQCVVVSRGHWVS